MRNPRAEIIYYTVLETGCYFETAGYAADIILNRFEADALDDTELYNLAQKAITIIQVLRCIGDVA